MNRFKAQYADYHLPQNAVVFSLDIVNLYGSILIDEAVETVSHLIHEHQKRHRSLRPINERPRPPFIPLSEQQLLPL